MRCRQMRPGSGVPRREILPMESNIRHVHISRQERKELLLLAIGFVAVWTIAAIVQGLV